MSEIQVIQSALDRAATRRRWHRALRGLWHGLLIGAILTLLLVSAYHLLPLPVWVVLLAAFVPFPCMVIGLVFGGWRKPKLQQVARWLDGRQHLQERLSTALEVADKPNAGSWRDLVVADAARHAQGLDPRKLLPFGLPKATRWALIVLALGAGLGFVPEYRSKAYLQKRNEQQIIKETGRQLADLTRHSLEKRLPAIETQKSMEAVATLGDQMTRQNLTRSDALKDLANVAEKLKDQLKELGKDPDLKRLEQMARSGNSSDSQSAGNLQKQIDALQKQTGSPNGNPDALDKVKQNLEKLQEAARGLADKNSSGDDSERQKLAQSLAALSKQVQDMGLNLPQLDEAISALAANQPELVLKDLDLATKDLEKMRELAKALQQMQQQAEKLGKDLAEQLKNGQPDIAQQTLQKMISQLNSANLTPEQLKKILGDVSKAVDPASNYGKVAEHLKSATQSMQSSDKNGAAKELAEAAKELAKLMDQMGDMQELQATLEALNQASMCIGTCQGWRACNKPGFRPGGKPGRGVGTWGDDSTEYDGSWTGAWDNSGVVRPDQDARGHTDRGAGDLNDALQPTKVKGQFSPGGQMPSITLKGVSIKGQSKVDYEQAASAAQSDAQSALSQDKVPRAYQGAVKDYFDDLKK
jgi:hypothetical protein